MEPQWWNAYKLKDDKRFIESNETGSYFDYDADFSVEEMRKMHEKFRPTDGLYTGEGWQEIIRPMLEKIDEALYSRSEDYSHFHVTVFEWDTGM